MAEKINSFSTKPVDGGVTITCQLKKEFTPSNPNHTASASFGNKTLTIEARIGDKNYIEEWTNITEKITSVDSPVLQNGQVSVTLKTPKPDELDSILKKRDSTQTATKKVDGGVTITCQLIEEFRPSNPNHTASASFGNGILTIEARMGDKIYMEEWPNITEEITRVESPVLKKGQVLVTLKTPTPNELNATLNK